MSELKPIPKNSLELLQIKQARINQAKQEILNMASNFEQTKKQAKIEAGIPEAEADKWDVSKDGEHFEKIESGDKDKK